MFHLTEGSIWMAFAAFTATGMVAFDMTFTKGSLGPLARSTPRRVAACAHGVLFVLLTIALLSADEQPLSSAWFSAYCTVIGMALVAAAVSPRRAYWTFRGAAALLAIGLATCLVLEFTGTLLLASEGNVLIRAVTVLVALLVIVRFVLLALKPTEHETRSDCPQTNGRRTPA
ncbi:MAG: hypothetical protein FJX72_10615 [Armatimonadetes bacterium]|nr:hypothetical protein [Armatimonadota bacterium]